MPIPSTLYPVQEVVEISEKHNLDTMPTPELQTQMTISRSEDGIFHINGQSLNEQTLEWLRTCAAQVEAQLKQKSIDSTPVITTTATTTVSQATDDCETYPTKAEPKISDIFPPVETVSTSVEVHSPDEVHKPWFGNISEGESDFLAKLLQSNGIHEEKVADKIDRTAKWATEQVTLGITGDLEEKTLKTEQEYNNLAQLNFAKPEQLPDYPALNNTDSFELEDTEVDKLLHQDPYLGEVITIKQEPENRAACDQFTTIDLGKLHPNLAAEQDDGMGPYRNPPSVSSAISNSTYTSDYANLLSPGNEFEALDESNVSMPQKVTGRRNTKRRTGGGKDLKRLGPSAKTAKSTMGKPYPPASARNGRLSRFQHGEFHENNLQEGWWNMLKNVEKLFQAHLDFPSAKVEELRKYCHDLFAVVLFSPVDWGNNQKRKGIYREALKNQYNWDPNVPFRSINNSPKKGDAPRANKDDLVKIGLYLMRRYQEEVRHLVKLKNDMNQLVTLVGVDKSAVTGFDALPATAPIPPFANTVHNHLAMASEVPKMEQLSLTPAEVEPVMTNALDFPAPVSQATVAAPAETVTSSYIAMETEPSSTVDLNMLLQCLGDNNHLVTTGNQTFDSLNIEPRQPEQQMDTDGDELNYKNPEMKALKREHSYSLPDEEKETEQLSNPVMTISHDCQMPGTVLQLAESKQSGLIKTVNNEDYMVAKLAETFPAEFSQILEFVEGMN